MIIWSHTDSMAETTYYYPTRRKAMDAFNAAEDDGWVEKVWIRDDLPPRELACLLLASEGYVTRSEIVAGEHP